MSKKTGYSQRTSVFGVNRNLNSTAVDHNNSGNSNVNSARRASVGSRRASVGSSGQQPNQRQNSSILFQVGVNVRSAIRDERTGGRTDIVHWTVGRRGRDGNTDRREGPAQTQDLLFFPFDVHTLGKVRQLSVDQPHSITKYRSNYQPIHGGRCSDRR